MKLSVITAVALLGATAAFGQTTGTGNSTETGTAAPGSMPATESMTTPPTDSTGTMSAAEPGSVMTEKMARQKLAGTGYGSLSGLKQTADGQWEAKARKGSKQQQVTIAPDGSVVPHTQ